MQSVSNTVSLLGLSSSPRIVLSFVPGVAEMNVNAGDTKTPTIHQGPVVQRPMSTNPGLTLNKTYRVNPGLVLIGL